MVWVILGSLLLVLFCLFIFQLTDVVGCVCCFLSSVMVWVVLGSVVLVLLCLLIFIVFVEFRGQ